MAKPVLHGPAFSTYVRSVRITLAEKGVDYEMREFNFLEGWPDGYESLHPFKKVPAFEHDGMKLYETPAIMLYINAGFGGPALLPEDAAMRAKTLQTVNVIDNYAYDALITRTFIPRAVVPMLGGATDESVIEGANSDAERAISVLDGMVSGQDYFGGTDASLADFHAVPVIHYTSQISDGQTLLSKAPALTAWFERMSGRESVSSTVPQLG
ncbi:MAG: glutathione S-transferase family protein [Gammaproteobacteria bacterium]|nr:glutathione S-transferase family protein [Gammaproteobacteria bacterium]MDH3468233.1 glutathione S-transferase family protein [Gammaproteobacteria bacterium]